MESYSIQRKQKRAPTTSRKRAKRHQNNFQCVSQDGWNLECYECHHIQKTTILLCSRCGSRILQTLSDTSRTVDAV